MKILLNNLLSPLTAEDIKNNLNNADAQMSPFFYNLVNDGKIGLRTMAEGREGYARLISKIASAHPEALARQDDPQDLVTRLLYDENLESIRQSLLKTLEKVTETQMANSADIMQYVDAYNDSLQSARKRDNNALDAAMADVDEWNKRFGRDQSGTENNTPS